MRNRNLFLGTSLVLLRTAAAITVVSGGVEYIGRLWNETLPQETFLGIPYAHASRFERPVAPTVSSPFNATAYGPICPQATATDGLIQSEDCLSVNVWRPVGTTAQSSLPVMVFIYGGSFVEGFSAVYPLSEFGHIAASDLGKPIIGVVFNYRTGAFGFPVGAKAEENGALNLGLYDQRAALEWVQNHIADFGGDKTKVTLFGHSAGSVSVGLQMLYNGGQIDSVFQRGIMQSGTPNTFGSQRASTPARETAYTFLVNNTGCASAANTFLCLKTVEFGTLNTAHWNAYLYQRDYEVLHYPWSAFAPAVTVGDSFMPIRPYEAISQGKFAKVPFIIGTTLDEGTFTPIPDTKQDSIDFLTLAIPGTDPGYSDAGDVAIITKLINEVYSDDPAAGSPYGTGDEIFGTSQYWKQLNSVSGDIHFEGPRRFFLREAVKQDVDVWSYQWVQPIDVPEFPPRYGISHIQEVYAEFRNWAVSPEGQDTGVVFIDYLTSFAYTGTSITPAKAELPTWEKYNQEAESLRFKYNDYEMIPDTFRASEIDFVIDELLSMN